MWSAVDVDADCVVQDTLAPDGARDDGRRDDGRRDDGSGDDRKRDGRDGSWGSGSSGTHEENIGASVDTVAKNADKDTTGVDTAGDTVEDTAGTGADTEDVNTATGAVDTVPVKDKDRDTDTDPVGKDITTDIATDANTATADLWRSAPLFEAHVRLSSIPGPHCLDACPANVLRCAGFSSPLRVLQELNLLPAGLLGCVGAGEVGGVGGMGGMGGMGGAEGGLGGGRGVGTGVLGLLASADMWGAFRLRNELVNLKKLLLHLFHQVCMYVCSAL
ncbi:hypothetical protein B484DRAFT_272228 [Ochromonadaceae sp. CCMP2298]|nr:hypothetical protein B484DRAFT_272228 [Ochromonadaceae sp. CCMP2298]